MTPLEKRTIDLRPDARATRARRRFVAGRPPRDRDAAMVETVPATTVRRRDRTHRVLLLLFDALAATVALLAVTGLQGLRPTSLLMPVLLLITYKVVGLYDRDESVMRRSTLEEVPRLAQMAGCFALLTWLFAGNFMSERMDRPDVLGLWVLVFAGTAAGRFLARLAARALTPAERLALAGDAATVERVREKIGASRINAEIVAHLHTSRQRGRPAALGSGAALRAWLRQHGVERLVIAHVGHSRQEDLDLIRLAKACGVRVSLLPRMFEAVGTSVDFEEVDGMTFLGLRSFGLSRSSRALKRSFDLAGAGLGLLAVAPVLAVIAAAIKLDSRGPVLFHQPRVGRDGEPFGMLKFRSMVDGADAMKAGLRERNEAEGLFKIADDPRVTRVGRLLRKTSLDELPQLLNVLRGEMSLVGPRPLVREEDALISGLDRQRLQLTPGMTGPWQILGPARVPLREMVSIDCLYVANWSLWGDVEILVRTVAHVLRRRGV